MPAPRSAMLLVVALLGLCYSASGAAVGGGSLVTVYRHPPSRVNCSLIAVKPETGTIHDIANATDLCNDGNLLLTAAAKTAVGSLSGAPVFYFTTARPPCSVHAVNPATGESKPVAKLQAGWTIVDVSVHESTLLVTTTDSVYSADVAAGAQLSKIADITKAGLGELSQAVLDYPTLYTVLTQTPTIVPVDLTSGTVGAPVSVALDGLVDTQFWPAQGTVVILADYQLYSVEPSTGHASHIIKIPDGIGYPSISTLSGNTFYFSDFQESYSVDLSSAAITYKYPFDGYFCQGNFRYLEL